jgi:hypothetical protein
MSFTAKSASTETEQLLIIARFKGDYVLLEAHRSSSDAPLDNAIISSGQGLEGGLARFTVKNYQAIGKHGAVTLLGIGASATQQLGLADVVEKFLHVHKEDELLTDAEALKLQDGICEIIRERPGETRKNKGEIALNTYDGVRYSHSVNNIRPSTEIKNGKRSMYPGRAAEIKEIKHSKEITPFAAKFLHAMPIDITLNKIVSDLMNEAVENHKNWRA